LRERKPGFHVAKPVWFKLVSFRGNKGLREEENEGRIIKKKGLKPKIKIKP
jgi:hypothetical protein